VGYIDAISAREQAIAMEQMNDVMLEIALSDNFEAVFEWAV
jgi:hypothetical protein